ncbi:aminotransferase class III-fold pyridoxal phosphate-dependent enzyme (plasmid) [Tistrella bauzanensis]|uniref:Aminotransferase class III-fold pyridoxal phosphate-dependent enzyme n=1 Tax=Tistrella arctica TaxID=3133430 RepID=A0ABU9YPL6_9PROT
MPDTVTAPQPHDAAQNSLDLSHHWMPFTANRAFKAAPRIITEAHGIWYRNDRGDQLIDGLSGLFCTPAGHGRREITEAVTAQLGRLDYAPPFQFGTPGGFAVATALARILPDGIDRVFFAGSGSEAVETALKIAMLYHRRRGEGQRQRVIGREKAYHGVNLAGWSVGGMVRNREMFGLGMAGVAHMRHTHIPENRFVLGEGAHGADLADDLERAVGLYGADTIAACIVEPISGSIGVLVPPQGYLARLREICDRHGILLIFDEVITGFGRTGKAFAAQSFGVTPDIITMAKAITNGTVPMAAVAASRMVYDTIVEDNPSGIEFFHGYTWSAHPVACAAALASLKIFQDEALFDRAAALSPHFLDRLGRLRAHGIVEDIRGYGMLGAADLAAGATMGARGFQALTALYDAGAIVRITNDTLIFAPPFVMEPADLDHLFDTVEKVLAGF